MHHHILILVISIQVSLKVTINGTNFFHMNISSLCHNFDELHTLLPRMRVKFNIIGITELD